MKVLSKSSRGVFEPSPSPPLILHDRISRQIHVTRMRHEFLKQRAGDILERGRSRWRGSGSSASSSFSPDYGGENGLTGWLSAVQAAGLSLRQRGCDPPGLPQPPRASKGTPRLSTNRLRPLATPGRAIPRLGVFRRGGDQRRRVLATPAPGHGNCEP